MIDHYKILGISETATKDEIKKAFREQAVRFHPDKHSHSPKPVKDEATLKFKRVSEAYQLLSDDQKRRDYDLRFRSLRHATYPRTGYGYSSGEGYYGNTTTDRTVWKFEVSINSRGLRNLLFAGVLLSAYAVINSSGEALWKMRNSGKSFEDTLESIEKAKSLKDET